MSDRAAGKRVAMLVEDEFEDYELTGPLDALKAAGIVVTLVGSTAGAEYTGKKGNAVVKADIGAGAAVIGIDSGAAEETVGPGLAGQHVVAAAAKDRIVAQAAQERIVAGAAVYFHHFHIPPGLRSSGVGTVLLWIAFIAMSGLGVFQAWRLLS